MSDQESREQEARDIMHEARDAGVPALVWLAGPLNATPEPCPECEQGKHGNCDGTAWDIDLDRLTDCPCHGAGHEAGQ